MSLPFVTTEIPKEIIITLATLAGSFVIYQLLFFLLSQWTKKKQRFIPTLLKEDIYYPGLFLIICISLWVTLQLAVNHLSREAFTNLRHAIIIASICSWAFIVSRLVSVTGKISLRRFVADDSINYSHRKARTKFELIQRILNVLIMFATVALILMTFKSVRQIGGTLLASAGVLGLILGFAAQKSLGTLFAGVQIAISQPIRIGDIVVVEGQYGTIGEITLTYVVVNTWDGRRLVVPINFFLEKSFENWTRTSPDIIGKVTIHADYSLPVDDVRNEFNRLVKESKLWDRRSSGFVVLSAGERTIELRGTMSAKDSGDAFDLECYLRERLIAYIRDRYPGCLPKQRLDRVNENS
jgi:small-conductance mechanosensitive channel